MFNFKKLCNFFARAETTTYVGRVTKNAMKKICIITIFIIIVLGLILGYFYFISKEKIDVLPAKDAPVSEISPEVLLFGDNYFRYKDNIYYMYRYYGKVDPSEVKTNDKESFDRFYKLVEGVDVNSFKNINNYYGRDNLHIFKGFTRIEDADISSFEVISDNFAKDKNRLYYSPDGGSDSVNNPDVKCIESIVSKMDVRSFLVMNNFIRDKNSIYYTHSHRTDGTHCIYEQIKVPGVESASFVEIGNNFYKDKNTIYTFNEYNRDRNFGFSKSCLNTLNADQISITAINDSYFKDKTNVYFNTNDKDIVKIPLFEVNQEVRAVNEFKNYLIIGDLVYYLGVQLKGSVDVKSFTVLYDGYSKDNNNLYYRDTIVQGANVNDINLIDNFYSDYVSSNGKIFFKEKEVSGANPENAKILGDSSYLVDNKYIYSNGDKLEGVKSDSDYDFSYFNIGNNKLFYKNNPDKSRAYNLFLNSGGKDVKLYSDVIGDCCGGGFPIFSYTSNPNVALLWSATGDACFGMQQKLYVDVSSKNILSVESGSSCDYSFVIVDNGIDKFNFDYIIVDEKNKRIDMEKDRCVAGKKYYFIGYSASPGIEYKFGDRTVVECGNLSDIGTSVFNIPEIDVESVSIDLHKIYIKSQSNYDCLPDKYFEFDVINKTIKPIDKSEITTLNPYKN